MARAPRAPAAALALLLLLAPSALARPDPDRRRGASAGGDGGRRGGGGGRRGAIGGDTIRILALGDSITQGSVPSKNENHPYTEQLQKRVEAATGKKVEIVNAGGWPGGEGERGDEVGPAAQRRGGRREGRRACGARERQRLAPAGPPSRAVSGSTAPRPGTPAVGGAGIFAVGFHNPTTLVPWARKQLAGRKFDWVVCLIGINDLLREGKPASEVGAGGVFGGMQGVAARATAETKALLSSWGGSWQACPDLRPPTPPQPTSPPPKHPTPPQRSSRASWTSTCRCSTPAPTSWQSRRCPRPASCRSERPGRTRGGQRGAAGGLGPPGLGLPLTHTSRHHSIPLPHCLLTPLARPTAPPPPPPPPPPRRKLHNPPTSHPPTSHSGTSRHPQDRLQGGRALQAQRPHRRHRQVVDARAPVGAAVRDLRPWHLRADELLGDVGVGAQELARRWPAPDARRELRGWQMDWLLC
jgi:lysophospholipase L1-like esterase